jgi:hypothetical protein
MAAGNYANFFRKNVGCLGLTRMDAWQKAHTRPCDRAAEPISAAQAELASSAKIAAGRGEILLALNWLTHDQVDDEDEREAAKERSQCPSDLVHATLACILINPVRGSDSENKPDPGPNSMKSKRH